MNSFFSLMKRRNVVSVFVILFCMVGLYIGSAFAGTYTVTTVRQLYRDGNHIASAVEEYSYPAPSDVHSRTVIDRYEKSTDYGTCHDRTEVYQRITYSDGTPPSESEYTIEGDC